MFSDREDAGGRRAWDIEPGARVEFDVLPGSLELRADSRFVRGVVKVEAKSGETVDVTIPAWFGGEVMTDGCARR